MRDIKQEISEIIKELHEVLIDVFTFLENQEKEGKMSSEMKTKIANIFMRDGKEVLKKIFYAYEAYLMKDKNW